MTYREYLKIVLPNMENRIINKTHWCDLFNNSWCNKRFPNYLGKSCDDCYDEEIKPSDGFDYIYQGMM